MMDGAVTMTEAARRLGISRVTLRRLVRDGTLPLLENPLDKRQKLIPEDAIAHVAAGHNGATRAPRPQSVGMVEDLGITSDEVDEWLEANWRLC